MIERSRQLTESWQANADAWANAVRRGAIPSRRLATNAAILEAVRERSPARVLDVGCGEGWLVHTLVAEGIQATGIDASARLVELARARGGGQFEVRTYSEVAEEPEALGAGYDVIICNFALLEEDVSPLLTALRTRLSRGGILLIQTLHPWAEVGQGSYQDGWRMEEFAELDGFVEPMPWYFRTLGSWVELLSSSGYRLEWLREPEHPVSKEPLSLLLAARAIASRPRTSRGSAAD